MKTPIKTAVKGPPLKIKLPAKPKPRSKTPLIATTKDGYKKR